LAGGINGYQYTRNPTGWVDPLGLNECPGADGCKRPGFGEEDPAGKVRVDGGEAQLPLYPEEKYLYRGDSRHPDEIFEHGFRPKGDSNNLLLHSLDSNKPPSNFVSTSPDREIGINFATNFNMRGGFLYSIRMIPGRDLKSELGAAYKFDSERELAIQGGVKREDILGVTPMGANGRPSSHTTLNPNRK
jgi:hypothetical protein